MVEKDFKGPGIIELKIPDMHFVGAVLMNIDNFSRTDVSNHLRIGNTIKCKVPKGNWKLMGFCLNPEFRPNSQKGGFVDYLDRDAVAKYIEINFDPYYRNLRDFFGSVIKRTIYDEPAMHLSDGRMWTPGFNREFEKRYNYSPMTLYPALWYDIGSETASARNILHGFRTDLFAENYLGQVAQWCENHGIKLSGHLDQEETRNPTGVNGDLMKAFKFQHIPSMDDIYFAGRSNVAYKIVASSCYNWDKPEFFVETYAAYRTLNPEISMRVALDQLAMGVNMQLSVRGKSPEMDTWLGRSCYMLRGGRHIADIAIVYPIASLHAAYSFSGPPKAGNRGSAPNMYYAYEGGIVPTEIDYMNLGETLFRGLRLDYTYLHPEVLSEKCTAENGRLILGNKVNSEEYRVVFLPGGNTVSAAVMAKLLEFYRRGGAIIATSKLPDRSSEPGRDREVREAVREIFGISSDVPLTTEITIVPDDFTSYFKNSGENKGRGYFLPQPYYNIIASVLREVITVKDVDIQLAPMWPVKIGTSYDGALTYIHKFRDGKDIYFFSNSTSGDISTKVKLRGEKNLERWDPHTGAAEKTEVIRTIEKGEPVTVVDVSLRPVSSVFFVGN